MDFLPDSRDHGWYLVYTKPREEFRALENLMNQGYTCFLPTVLVNRLERVSTGEVEVPLFSRYLFIHLSLTNSLWQSIRSTRGVSRLVSFGGRFTRAPDELINILRRAPKQLQRPFEPGERVVIRRGPFAGIDGILQETDGEHRALLLIELLGKPQQLLFATAILERVG